MLTPLWLDLSRSHIQLHPHLLSSITANWVQINPGIEGTIGEITEELKGAFQAKSRELSQFLIVHKGSGLARLFLPDLRIADHDVQILLFPGSSRDDLEKIFSTAQEIMGIALKLLVKKKFPYLEFTPRNPKTSYFYGKPNENGIASKHFMARLRLSPSRPGHLPLDLSIHIFDSSIKSLSSFNLEAFYMPVGKPHCIYSELDGEISHLIEELQGRKLRCNTHDTHKFGFYRYITAITHLGLTALDAKTGEKLLTVDAQQELYMPVEMKKYITEKKIQGPYLLYLLNALFQLPDTHSLVPSMTRECLREAALFENEINLFGFISQALRGLRISPERDLLPKEVNKVFITLKLLIPYLSETSWVKMHADKLHVLCQLSCFGISFYLLVPFLNETEEENFADLFTSSIFDPIHQPSVGHLLTLLENKQFPIKISHFLVSGSYTPDSLFLLLNACSIDTLSEKEAIHLVDSIPKFLQILRETPFPLRFLIDLINKYPEKGSKNLIYHPIFHTIKSYTDNLHQAPDIIWEEILTLALLSTDRKINQWKKLYLYILSLPDITFLKPCDAFCHFAHFLIERSGSIAFNKAELCIKAIALLALISAENGEPAPLLELHRSTIQSLTDFEVLEQDQQTALNCLENKQSLDPLCFTHHFTNFLATSKLEKAKRLLQYQEIIFKYEDYLEAYENLFKASLQCQSEEIAFFCLKFLCNKKEDSIQHLYDFHCIFSLDPFFLLQVLQKKRKMICSAYGLFHTFKKIASVLEQEFLMNGKLDESEYSSISFEKSILTRIEQTDFKTAFALTSHISNKTLFLQALFMLMKKEAIFANRLSLLRFVLNHFPEHLYDLLAEGIAHFERAEKIHAFILEIIKKQSQLPPKKILEIYFSLFIKQTDINSEKNGSFLLEIAPYYLLNTTDDHRFDLIEKCSSLPLHNYTLQLFALTINSVKNLKVFFEKYERNHLHIPYWIEYLKQPLNLSEKKEKILTTKVHDLLLSCEILSLEEKEINFLFEKILSIIQKIEDPSLTLAIKYLKAKPEKITLKLTRGCIKQLLDRYQSNLQGMPDALWEECCEILLLSSADNPMAWNALLTNHLMPLLIQSKMNPIRESILKFIHLLCERAAPLSIDYYIQSLILLGPDFISLSTLLDHELQNKQIEKIRPYFNDTLFSSLLENRECKKALKLLHYREPIPETERIISYCQIFNRSLEIGDQQEVKFCLMALQKIQEPYSFMTSLDSYHALFPLDIEIFRLFLNLNKNLICPLYAHFYNVDSIAKIIENEFLKNIEEDSLQIEETSLYERALVSRIEKLLSQGESELAFILAKKLPRSSSPSEEIFKNILVSLFETSTSDTLKEDALKFAGLRFPRSLEHILSLHSEYSNLRDSSFVHNAILQLSIENIHSLSKELLNSYAHFYINRLETFISSSSINRQKQMELYFSKDSEALRFDFALKCAFLLPSSEITKAFAWATSCEKSLTIYLSNYTWNSSEVRKWLSLLPRKIDAHPSALSKESFVDTLLKKINDFSASGMLDILLEMRSFFIEERELSFIEQYKQSLNSEDLLILTHPDFSPILLKDHDLYRGFLNSSLRFVQSCNSHEPHVESKLKTLLKLVQKPTPTQQIDSYQLIDSGYIEEEDQIRFLIASSCLRLLPTYSGSLGWITRYIAQNINLPSMYEHSCQLIRLSPKTKTIIPLLRTFTEVMFKEPDEIETTTLEMAVQEDKIEQNFDLDPLTMQDNHFFESKATSFANYSHSKGYIKTSSSIIISKVILLKNFLTTLSACRLNEKDLLELAPLLKKIPYFLITSSYAIPRLKILSSLNAPSPEEDVHMRESFEKIIARNYILNPQELFDASKELIELISQYLHALPSLWYEKEAPKLEQVTPAQLIKNLTIKIHITKLKIASRINDSTNCIADLKVYISHLKRIFITKEIPFDPGLVESKNHFLSYDDLVILMRDAQKHFPLEGLGVYQLFQTTTSQICDQGITQSHILDLAIARLALIFCQDKHKETPRTSRSIEVIRNIFLSISNLEETPEDLSLWTFRKSCDLLRLYLKSAHPDSPYQTFSLPPILRLPKQFTIKLIQRSFVLLSYHALRTAPTERMISKEDITCLATSAYFASEYTAQTRNYEHFIKDIPINIVLCIPTLFPGKEGSELIQKIFNEIEIEERKEGIDYCKNFFADVKRLQEIA